MGDCTNAVYSTRLFFTFQKVKIFVAHQTANSAQKYGGALKFHIYENLNSTDALKIHNKKKGFNKR